MKVLFIGGTGVISSACSALAVERGIELYHFNRGKSIRKIDGVKNITGDIRNVDLAKNILHDYKFDVVVDWICFSPKQAEDDIELFKGITKQFVFISSASVYQTPPQSLPITENTPADNPFWKYSQDKIGCENVFLDAYKNGDLNTTIVRPSHTYDKTMIPIMGGYTAFDRMKKGKKVLVHGDGTSVWVLTHNKDFAKGFVGLLGNEKAFGEIFQITSDELLNWNQIYNLIAEAAGVKADIVHVPSDFIAKYDSEIGDGLLGDKAHSMIFDNSKIKSVVPGFSADIKFEQGVKEIVEWYNSPESNGTINEKFNQMVDTIIGEYRL